MYSGQEQMKYVNGAFRVDRSQAKWNRNGSSGSKFEVHGVAMSRSERLAHNDNKFYA